MYWWAVPSSPFVVVGVDVASLSSSIPLRRRPLLLSSFVAVIRSCPLHVLPFLSVADVRWWWCCISWVCACPIVASGGHGWFSQVLVVVSCLLCPLCIVVSFAHCCVICAFLLSLLGSCGGSHCCSWMAGIV